jgi:hypothetical protein
MSDLLSGGCRRLWYLHIMWWERSVKCVKISVLQISKEAKEDVTLDGERANVTLRDTLLNSIDIREKQIVAIRLQ